MSLRIAYRTLGLALALATAACASTPAARIEKAPAEFAQLPVEQQDKVRSGVVEIGYGEAAVRLALGEPDRIIERTTADGRALVWQYFEPVTPPSIYCQPGFYRGYYLPPICYSGFGYTEHERMRLSFKDGALTAIEREKP